MGLRGIMVAFGLLAIQATGFVQCRQIHELMTDEEIFKVFRTTRDNVPEYQVAPIMHDMYKRATDYGNRVQLHTLSRDIEIHVNPWDGGNLAGERTPVWLASADKEGQINFKKLSSNVMGTVGKSYLSLVPPLAVTIDKDLESGRLRIEGIIEDHVITPLPARLQDSVNYEAVKQKREVTNSSRTLIASDYHVIIKSKSLPSTNAAVEKKVEDIVRHYNKTEFDEHRRKRWANAIIYPRILIVTDYAGTSRSEDESAYYDDIRYQLAFWNAVDLRFRHMENPKIRLRIAGLVIGQGREATPYIKKWIKGDEFHVYDGYRLKGPYWYNQRFNPDFNPQGYDIVMTMTDIPMIDARDRTQKPIITLGVASVGTLCDGPIWQRIETIGFTHDDGKFSGVSTAAHELGHIFGADHDTDVSGNCTKEQGYIMAPEKIHVPTAHFAEWSPCSLKKIKEVMGGNRHCADNPVGNEVAGKPIYRIAPGDIRSAEQQCEDFDYSYSCDPEPKTCKRLQCRYAGLRGIWNGGWSCQNAPEPALDGTPCSPKGVCMHGRCLEIS